MPSVQPPPSRSSAPVEGAPRRFSSGDRDRWAKAVAVARSQLGVASYSQLLDAGLTRQQIRTMTARGEWARELRGVYRLGAAQVTWESRLRAHLLAAGPTALASHRAAAVLYRLEGFSRGTPEISVRRGDKYGHRSVHVHHSSDLHLVRSEIRNTVPITPPARTLLDLAGVVAREKAHAALEDAIRRNLVTWDGILACLVTHARRGRPGVGPLRGLTDEHRAEVVATENGFERLVLVALIQAGLPRPAVQHEVTIGADVYRLDLAYPTARLAIELDGSKHREKDAFERDRPRQNALILAGWTVLRYTWAYYRRRCAALVREVREALGPAVATPDN